MGLVLDTSSLIALERLGGDWADTEGLLGPLAAEPTVIPATVLGELLIGAHMADTPARAMHRKARIDALTMRCPIVEFGQSIAERWSNLFSDLNSAGEMIPSNDICIAATAVHLGFGVLVESHDESHFRRVPGLRVELVQA